MAAVPFKSKKNVLGRGLDALIPQREGTASLAHIPISQISPNPYQPRKSFDDSTLTELAESIGKHGVVQPLIVSKLGPDSFQIIAGERRFRAAQKAGLTRVPAVVKELTGNGELLQIALIENVQRQDLNPIEEAVAYEQLHQEFALTQEEIAKQVGKQRSTVANCLRLLKLPDRVKAMLASGELSMGHARALLGVDKGVEALAERIVRDGLNVRQTEALTGEDRSAPRTKKTKDVFTRDAEEKLSRRLGTRVEIQRRKRGGIINIAFANEDELIRLHGTLAEAGARR